MSTTEWRIEKVRSDWKHTINPPKAPANTALVVFQRGVCLGLIGPHIKLNPKDCAVGQYEFWFIPMSERKTVVPERLASTQLSVYFDTSIELRYRVSNPEQVARHNPTSLDAAVADEIHAMLREYGGRHGPTEHLALEQAIKTHLMRRKQIEPGVEILGVVPRVKMDTGIEAGHRKIGEIVGQRPIRDAEHESELAELKRQAAILRGKTEVETARVEGQISISRLKAEEYTRILKLGRFEQFGQLLSEPDNATLKQIVDHFEAQREQDVAMRWTLFKEWMKSDDTGLIAERIRTFVLGMEGLNNPLVNNRTSLSDGQSKPKLVDDDDYPDWMKGGEADGEGDTTTK